MLRPPPITTRSIDILDEETPLTPHQFIEELEKQNDQLQQKIKEQAKKMAHLEKLHEDEKNVREKLNNCLQSKNTLYTKLDQQYKNNLNDIKEKEKELIHLKKQASEKDVEIERLKKILASPTDKKTDEFLQFELVKYKSLAEEAKKETISLTSHYEAVMKELALTKKELVELRKRFSDHETKGSSPLFFQETKSYNKGEKSIIIPPTFSI